MTLAVSRTSYDLIGAETLRRLMRMHEIRGFELRLERRDRIESKTKRRAAHSAQRCMPASGGDGKHGAIL
jgi:hypothetical protein